MRRGGISEKRDEQDVRCVIRQVPACEDLEAAQELFRETVADIGGEEVKGQHLGDFNGKI